MSQSKSKSRALSPEELAAFGAELDALQQQAIADVGESDARYIRNVLKTQRYSEVAGRALLMAGFLPPAWLAGTALIHSLAVSEKRNLFRAWTVLLAIVVIWYVAAVGMNAQWVRDQAARSDTVLTTTQFIGQTLTLDRPVLPAPHQVAVGLQHHVDEVDDDHAFAESFTGPLL